MTEKAYVIQFDCADTKKRRTALIMKYIDAELIPKFEIQVIDGEYLTPNKFNKAVSGFWHNIKNRKEVHQNFDWLAFYGADFQRFIETCEGLLE